MKFLFQLALGLILVEAPLVNASDLAILRNGNSIRHERRQVVGQVTRLYLSDAASGYVEIPTEQIERFEHDTAPAPPKSISPSLLPSLVKIQPRATTAIAAAPIQSNINQYRLAPLTIS